MTDGNTNGGSITEQYCQMAFMPSSIWSCCSCCTSVTALPSGQRFPVSLMLCYTLSGLLNEYSIHFWRHSHRFGDQVYQADTVAVFLTCLYILSHMGPSSKQLAYIAAFVRGTSVIPVWNPLYGETRTMHDVSRRLCCSVCGGLAGCLLFGCSALGRLRDCHTSQQMSLCTAVLRS